MMKKYLELAELLRAEAVAVAEVMAPEAQGVRIQVRAALPDR